MNKSFTFIILATIGLTSCFKSENTHLNSTDVSKGYELEVSCRGHVQEELYVDAISGDHVENFGIVGAAPKGRDGSAVVGFSPITIGKPYYVQWGVKGQDGLAMKHRRSFETTELLPLASKIRSLQLLFDGGEHWELRAYDASTSSEYRELLLAIQGK